MSLKHYTLVLCAAFMLISCHVAESRRFPPNIHPGNNGNIVHSELNRPDLRPRLLDFILQLRGSSVQQLHDKIAAADGNLELVIDGINSELKADIVRIDGEIIRLNAEEVKVLLKEAFQAAIRQRFSNDLATLSALEERLNKHFADKSDVITELIEKHAVPLESARTFLENHIINGRNKRSLQPKQFDLNEAVNGMLSNLLQQQLEGIIAGFGCNLLENAKNSILQLRVSTAPANEIERMISFAINTLVNKGVELITNIQQSLSCSNGTVSRRRRDVGDSVGTPAPNGGSSTEAQDNSGGSGGPMSGLLGILLNPLLTLLSVLLTPVRLLLQGLGQLLSAVLSPILGNSVVNSISNVLNSILGLITPW